MKDCVAQIKRKGGGDEIIAERVVEYSVEAREVESKWNEVKK